MTPAAPKKDSKIVGSIEYFRVGDEVDMQCARCGSSCFRVECPECGGEGYVEDDDDGMGDAEIVTCSECHGIGGYWRCISSREYCEAHPKAGRDSIPSSALRPGEEVD